MKKMNQEVIWSEVLDEDFRSVPKGLAESFSDKTLLVTGATGLVGSLLLKYLLYVRETGGLNVELVAVARNQEKARSIFGRFYDDIEWVFADLASDEIEYPGPIDFVVHGAAVTTSKTMVERPVEVIDLSIQGTRAMLELAREKGAVLLYLSSMEVYGTMPAVERVTEHALGYIDLFNVRSCYPESKRLCENLCVAYGAEFGVDARVARLAQTFGAGVLPGENRAVVAFSRAASKGEFVCLKTKGLSEANYVYASDAVSALLTILLRGKGGEAYNVANEACHMTIAEMAQLAIDTVGTPDAKLVFDVDESNASGFAADAKLFLSSEKLRALGWGPRVDLPTAMTRLVSYLEEPAHE